MLDLKGVAVDPFRADGASAIVFLFISTDCPISNRYAPEIKRLHARFAPLGARFRLIYPNSDDSAPAIRKHLVDFGYSFEALRDPQHRLVMRAGVSVTPEVAVFAPSRTLLYRGRIDDRFPRLGVDRTVPTQHDLENALVAILGGRPVNRALTSAVGCSIGSLP